MDAIKARTTVDRFLTEYGQTSGIVRKEAKELKRARKKMKTAIEAQQTAQQIVQGIQTATHKQLSSVVTRCLEATFPDPYKFKFIFERKRGRTEARPIFIRDGKELDPISSAGGAPGDCAALALRIACIKLSKPAKRAFIILDEPFGSVDEEKQDLFRELLETLSKELVQIVLITHNPKWHIGKVIRIGS